MFITRIRYVALAIAAVVLATSACATESPSPDFEKQAPLLPGLGNHTHSITTASADAQRYFNQGLTLGFAFNHAEAERSFRHAAALDPQCAMCWWGVAYVLGPNINATMDAAGVVPAWEAIQKAQALTTKATPREQAYIAALAHRYEGAANRPDASGRSLRQRDAGRRPPVSQRSGRFRTVC